MNATTLKVLMSIESYWKEHKFSPSVRDIMDITEINSSSHVLVHLNKLEEEDWIIRVPNVSRSIVIVKRYFLTNASVSTATNLE